MLPVCFTFVLRLCFFIFQWDHAHERSTEYYYLIGVLPGGTLCVGSLFHQHVLYSLLSFGSPLLYNKVGVLR